MTTFALKSAVLRSALVLAVISLAVLAGILPRAASSPPATPPSVAAPEWELKDVEGKPVKLSDLKGKVVILDFWATWCGPCRMEIPGFVELQKQYGRQGLAVIGVSLDAAGPQAVKPFMKQFSINYPIVMADEKVVRDYGGIEVIPTTFVINRRGMIVGKHEGYVERQELEKEIKRLLMTE